MVPNVSSSPPNNLPVLSELEEMFIARIHPVMACYRKTSGHSGMKGHCANVYQDHTAVLNSLPQRVEDLPVYLAARPANVAADEVDFAPLIVRREAILRWLTFLQKNNPLYHEDTGFTIDMTALNKLPENGVPDGLRRMFDATGSTSGNDVERHPCDEAGGEDDGPVITHSFFPKNKLPQESVKTKMAAAFAQFNARKPDVPSDVRNTEHVDWPKLFGIVNELEETRGYAALAFPVLFPYGPDGDPTVPDRKVDVDLQPALKHLLQYGVKREDGTTCHTVDFRFGRSTLCSGNRRWGEVTITSSKIRTTR